MRIGQLAKRTGVSIKALPLRGIRCLNGAAERLSSGWV